MITLSAPFELPITTIFLNDPTFNDTVGLLGTINQKRMINNIQYTYVKRKDRRKINYTLILTFEKAIEFQLFVNAHITNNIKMNNHNGETWKVKLVSDPFTYTTKTRDNRIEVLVVFEGIRLNAPNINC